MHSHAKSWVHGLLFLAAAGSGLAASTHDLPSALDSPAVSGWVLADLNGDQNVDLATARSGRHDASGYAQEVRVTLGAFQQTSFHFLSPGATVELSSQDVDGDDDGDLIVFEPLSSQPIGVWINDGAGTFHEGRLADFRKLWSERPGSVWRARLAQLPLFAISEERTQSLAPSAAILAPESVVVGRIYQYQSYSADAGCSDSRPRGPPRNS
ncbi:MAG TPA: hypothetical protein VGQ49_19985 [Bryobacteraceae bacterium]|nr:hypothetical protein [Bryobacteraceae bacterium]